jgi:hypothetical protein
MRRLLISLVLMLVCVGCGKKELDRQTASKLLANIQFETVKGGFLVDGRLVDNDDTGAPPGLVLLSGEALKEFETAGLISCPAPFTCSPGPNGGALASEPNGLNYSYDAGVFAVAEVVRIQQQTPTTAIAQVRLELRLSPLYARYKKTLDGVESDLAEKTAPRMTDVQFVLFDDGWRPQYATQ